MSDSLLGNGSGFSTLRQYIDQECGIYVTESKVYLFENRLQELMKESKVDSYDKLCYKAKTDITGKLRERIIDALTTNETLWFRDERPWKLLEEHIIPNFVQDLKEKKKDRIRIWSAGCSTGQEPYSLAMLLDKYAREHPSQQVNLDAFEILGTDISPTALFVAISGKYNSIMMNRGIGNNLIKRHFTEEGSVWAINPDIKKRVTFRKFNLLEPFGLLGMFDLILCRNVAVYFKEEVKQDLFTRFGKVMNMDGYFMLGSSESLMGFNTPFLSKSYSGIGYYQKTTGK